MIAGRYAEVTVKEGLARFLQLWRERFTRKNMGNMGRISRKKKKKLRKERRTGVTVVEDSIKTLIV